MNLNLTDILDIYAPTKNGASELMGGSTQISSIALQLLVLFDGKLAVAEVAALAKGISSKELQETISMLLKRGYIELKLPGKDVSPDFQGFFSAASSAPISKEILEKGGVEADKATASLRQKGYYVNIARRAEQKRKPASGAQYSVLVIEDNVDLQKVLGFLLKFEEFKPGVASTRAEILTALRTLPSPDVILLDVNLPDINGFDVLASIRRHPMLKTIPVIMLTAQSTRQDVLRGLAGGADGYITKPFEHDILMIAIRAVLGYE